MKDYLGKMIEISEKKFGITALKPFQILVMHRILEQDDYSEETQIKHQIVILPTGTGKSICFLLPATLCKGITVIIYPLLALMNDQIKKLIKSNIKCCCLRGGQTKKQREHIFSELKNGVKILITNPEVLCQKKILAELSNFNISLFVCDEAHVISTWGKSFRQSYLQLGTAVSVLSPKQVLCFTATASDSTIKDIKHCLLNNIKYKNTLTVKGDMDRENIFYCTYRAFSREQGVLNLIKCCEKPAIVFCRTRLSVMKMCTTALRHFPETEQRYYHAGLKRDERERIENWFLKSNGGILYSTCAYGMGVDKKNVRSIIHFDLPNKAEEYLQESGRAGRDGKLSVAYVIVSEIKKKQNEELTDIFTGTNCRRLELLRKMGQEKDECTGCDVCWGIKSDVKPEVDIIKKIISRYPLRYSASSIASILTGSKDRKIISECEKTNPYYNILPEYDSDLLQNSISQYVKENHRIIGKITLGKNKDVLFRKYWHKENKSL